MTAFARYREPSEFGDVAWEIRSINHRFLEITIRLPEPFRSIEFSIRDKIREKIQRGKIECFLKINPHSNEPKPLKLNKSVLKNLAKIQHDMKEYFSQTQADLFEILDWPGVIQNVEEDAEKNEKKLLSTFDKALKELLDNRIKEGENIKNIIVNKLKTIQDIIEKIKPKLPDIIKVQRSLLLQRFEEAKIELDANRVEQEMVLLAQRLDIVEEIDRLDIHTKECLSTLRKGGAVGRRLDFLLQELHREANTMAAKSSDTDILSYTIELRVLIEQMREQIQNVE